MVTKLVPSSGKSFPMNMVLTPLVPTTETQTCNWKESTSTIMKPLEEREVVPFSVLAVEEGAVTVEPPIVVVEMAVLGQVISLVKMEDKLPLVLGELVLLEQLVPLEFLGKLVVETEVVVE